MESNHRLDDHFLRRAKQLAFHGGRSVSPNPQVGAVIVYQGKIIGEGYHQKVGEAHAEVNALNSVLAKNRAFLKQSTAYVSLEPCSHYGKTPPCALALIEAGISRVVIADKDRSAKVNGRGIKMLQKREISTTVYSTNEANILPHCAFQIANQLNRPRIILKYAQSQDQFLGKKNESVWLTNAWSKRLVHRWRSEVGAIIIGTNTALTDDPILNTRYGFGADPIRVILDFNHRLKSDLKVFGVHSPIWIVTHKLPENPVVLDHVKYKIVPNKGEVLKNLNSLLLEAGIIDLFVEGGAQLLQSYLDAGLWDEARVFTANKKMVSGIQAPAIDDGYIWKSFHLLNDKLSVYHQPIKS